MPAYQRETTRQGIIRDTARVINAAFSVMSVKDARQNIDIRIMPIINLNAQRKAYYNDLSRLGKTRLYNAIARKAYETSDHFRLECIRANPTTHKYFNSYGNPYWR